MGCRCTELQTYMFRLHWNEKMMTSEIVSMMSMFHEPEEIFPLVFSLKEEGNTLVKSRKFEEAFAIYTKAVTFLVLGLPCCAEGCHPFQDLAIPLNLNIAMCALKLSKFQWAKYLCDCVLEFDPINVKALFRRALAALGLGQLRWAEKDLTVANKVEPQNGDVLRELNKVTLLLHESFSVVAEPSKDEDMDIAPKDDIPTSCLGESSLSFNPLKLPSKVSPNLVDNGGAESVGSNFNGVSSDNLVGSIANLSNDCVDPPKAISELEDTISTSGSSCPSFNTNLAEPKRFSNQARPGSILTLSQPDYKKLASGQVLRFSNLGTIGFMSIRVKSSINKLDPNSEMEEDDRASAIILERIDHVADIVLNTPGNLANACGDDCISSYSTNQKSPITPVTPAFVSVEFCKQDINCSSDLRSPRFNRRHPFVPAVKFGGGKRRLKRFIKCSTTSRVHPTPGTKRKTISNFFISSYPVWKKRMLNNSEDKTLVMIKDDLNAVVTNETASLQSLGCFSFS